MPDIMDRRKWIDESTPVSHDPRLIPQPEEPGGPAGSIALTGGRIFDGRGTAVYEGTVIVEGNRITAVGPAEEVDIPSDARVIDVAGKTVMPGMVDLHCHLTFTESEIPPSQGQCLADAALRGVDRMLVWLQTGITSLRDAGSHGMAPYRLKEFVRQNRLPGPRIFPAGCLITGTGGHGAETLDHASPMLGIIREASGPDDWRNAAREQFKRGADIIKIASHFSREEVAAVVDEAHSLGLKVMCDAETHYIDWAVEAGVDTIEHPLPRTDEVIKLMAQKGVAAVPTAVAYVIIFDRLGGYFGSSSRRFTFSKNDNVRMIERMKAAGVKMGVGTDVIFDDFRMFPAPYIVELKLFCEAGFSVEEALMAATSRGAEILGMDHLLGTLEAGKLADVLVV
ncbi:MAG: amidohydrolase family protein, partial [Bacillota bacterium]